MRMRLSRFSVPGLSVLVAVLVLAGMALGQDASERVAGAAVMGTVMLFVLVTCAAVYIYMALALQTIATKTSTANGWLAWIPIANLILMLSIAKKPMWWILLFLIPLVNIVIAIMVWMAVAEARGKPNWWGILTIIPGVNLIVPGYLAWSD